MTNVVNAEQFYRKHFFDGEHEAWEFGYYGKIESRIQDPPIGVADGKAYIVPLGATFLNWVGQDNKIAIYKLRGVLSPGYWYFVQPEVGCYVEIKDEGHYYTWNGVQWVMSQARYPRNFFNGLQISWVSVSQIQIVAGICASDDRTQLIEATSPITVDITAFGVNGLDTGVEAASTWYYIWLIKNISTNTVAGLISASYTTPTLPAGYTVKRLLGAVRNDAGLNILNFFCCGEGFNRLVYYFEDIDSTLQVLANGNNTSPTALSLATLVPPISRRPLLQAHVNATDGWLRTTGTTPNTVHIYANRQSHIELITDTSQQIDWYVNTPAGRMFISVRGYCFRV